MSDLTEIEIFDCLAENFKIAAECAEKLAISSRKGPTYHQLRVALASVEGSCQQVAFWRGDTRWLALGRLAAEAHKRAGDWLRGYKAKSGLRIAFTAGEINPLFTMLAANLRAAEKLTRLTRTRKTGILGPVLPTPAVVPRRPSSRMTPGGIILP